MTETHKMAIKGHRILWSERVDIGTVVCRLFIILLLSTLLIGTGCTTSSTERARTRQLIYIKKRPEQLFGKATA